MPTATRETTEIAPLSARVRELEAGLARVHLGELEKRFREESRRVRQLEVDAIDSLEAARELPLAIESVRLLRAELGEARRVEPPLRAAVEDARRAEAKALRQLYDAETQERIGGLLPVLKQAYAVLDAAAAARSGFAVRHGACQEIVDPSPEALRNRFQFIERMLRETLSAARA